MNSYTKIFTILTSKDQRRSFWLCVAMFIGALFEAVGIGLIFPLLSLMERPDYLENHARFSFYAEMIGINTYSQLVMAGALGLLLLYLFKNSYLTLLVKWQVDFSLKLQIDYAKQLYANYLLKPYLYHVNHNTAKLLRNAYDGPRLIFSVILISTLLLWTEIFTVIVLGVMLFFIDAFSVMVVGGGVGVIVYGILQLLRRSIGMQGAIQNRYSGEMYQWVNQGLGSIKETKVLGRELCFFSAYGAAYEKYGTAYRIFYFISQIPRFIIETLVVTGLLLLIIGKILVGGDSSDIVPLLGVLVLVAFRVMPCANRIVSYLNVIKFNMPIFEELYEELLDIRKRRTQDEHMENFRIVKEKMLFVKEICVEHLEFCYLKGGKKILDDISLTIQKGDFVGIIGASGAGKTTFVDLLLGLLSPSSGNIFVDGVSIYKNIHAWQANLAYVPQQIYLIDGTLRENVALGFSGLQIDDTRVWDALRMAELYDYVKDLPEELDTAVGENGMKLSGGQRQRIGIARALYASPEVLVLDEATSSLDDTTEKSITDTILKLKGQLTIIAIAHRTTTLNDCDILINFSHGNATVQRGLKRG